MKLKSDIRCKTEKCIAVIAKYGEHYHGVNTVTDAPEFAQDAVAKCERCGGYTNGTEWKHVCQMCGKEVKPGELVGFFVPHRCHECDTKIVVNEKAGVKVCGRCGKVHAYCCC